MVLTWRWWGPDRGPDLWPTYAAVFDEAAVFGDAHRDEWLESVWSRHSDREGFRCRVAVNADGTVLGFGYGYTGQPGQWWSDQATGALEPDVADEWVGGHFELVELGVLPAGRGRGLGTRLHDDLLDGLPHERALLSTSDNDTDPGRRLYAKRGWQELGALPWGAVILGLRLDV